jgi:hypothetical protein
LTESGSKYTRARANITSGSFEVTVKTPDRQANYGRGHVDELAMLAAV